MITQTIYPGIPLRLSEILSDPSFNDTFQRASEISRKAKPNRTCFFSTYVSMDHERLEDGLTQTINEPRLIRGQVLKDELQTEIKRGRGFYSPMDAMGLVYVTFKPSTGDYLRKNDLDLLEEIRINNQTVTTPERDTREKGFIVNPAYIIVFYDHNQDQQMLILQEKDPCKPLTEQSLVTDVDFEFKGIKRLEAFLDRKKEEYNSLLMNLNSLPHVQARYNIFQTPIILEERRIPIIGLSGREWDGTSPRFPKKTQEALEEAQRGLTGDNDGSDYGCIDDAPES